MKILRDAIQTLATTLGLQVLGVTRSIFLPLLLSPAQLGIWNLMSICIGYGAHIHFGLLHGYNKLLPAYISRRNFGPGILLRASVQSVNLHLSLIAAFLITFYALIYKAQYTVEFLSLAAIVVLQSVFQYCTSTLRSELNFSVLNKGMFLHSVLMTSFVILLMLIFENKVLSGLIGVAISFFLSSLFLSGHVEVKYPARFDLKTTITTFKTGAPVFVLGIGDIILTTSDRWIVALKFSESELGYYTLAVMLNAIIVMVASSISNVIYPRLLSTFGSGTKSTTIENKIIATVNLLSLFLLTLISILFFLLPIIITNFFPNYSRSNEVLKVSLFGVYYLSIANLSTTFVISKNKQNWLIFLQLLSLSLFVVVFTVTKKIDLELHQFSILVASIYAAYGTGCLFIATLLIKGNVKNTMIYCLTLCAPPILIFITLTKIGSTITTSSLSTAQWTLLVSVCGLIIIILFKRISKNLKVIFPKSTNSLIL